MTLIGSRYSARPGQIGLRTMLNAGTEAIARGAIFGELRVNHADASRLMERIRQPMAGSSALLVQRSGVAVAARRCRDLREGAAPSLTWAAGDRDDKRIGGRPKACTGSTSRSWGKWGS